MGDQSVARKDPSATPIAETAAPQRTPTSTPGRVQARLTVGHVDDPAEAAADSLAARAIADLRRQPQRSAVERSPATGDASRLQRSAMSIRDDTTTAGTRVRRATDGVLRDPAAGGELDARTTGRIESARGRGKALPPRLQRSFETTFGSPFDGVRVHTDNEAADLSSSISARAFTTGGDIFFGRGEYRPDDTTGQELIAHEVAHTVQQGSATRRVPMRRMPVQRAEGDTVAPSTLSTIDVVQFEVHTILLRTALQPLIPSLTLLMTNAVMPAIDPGALALVESLKPMSLGLLDQLERTLERARPVLSKVSKVILDAEDPLAPLISHWMQTIDSISSKILLWRAMVLSTTCGVPLVGQVVGDVATTAATVSSLSSSALEAARRFADDPSVLPTPTAPPSAPPAPSAPVRLPAEAAPATAGVVAGSASAPSSVEPLAGASSSAPGSLIGDALSGSGGNKEPKSYPELNVLGNGFETESTEGSPVAEAIIQAAHQAVAAKRAPSIGEYMIKRYGWEQRDVDKYIAGGHKALVRYVKPSDRVHYEAYGSNPVRYGLDWENVLDTTDMFSKHSGAQFGIYVMAPDGTMYVGQHKVGLFHHSSFLSGANVAAGGEIRAVDGDIKVVTNKTGHYRSDERNLWQVLDELKSRGISLSGIKVATMTGLQCGAADFYARFAPNGAAPVGAGTQ